jgi:hypothetical protein
VYAADDPKPADLDQTFQAPNGLTIRVKAIKPQNMETDLQITGYFQHDPKGDIFIDVLIDMNNMLGGAVQNLRNRGEFVGYERETLVITPPRGLMKPKRLMMIGYGPRNDIKLDTMSRVAGAVVREAIRLQATRPAYAPALIDQGFKGFPPASVGEAFIQGLVLAYDTEMRLQRQGLSKPFTFQEFALEAGPHYFKDVISGVEKGVEKARAEIGRRSIAPYSSTK